MKNTDLTRVDCRAVVSGIQSLTRRLNTVERNRWVVNKVGEHTNCVRAATHARNNRVGERTGLCEDLCTCLG